MDRAGIPDNPEGWIMMVARNHALDVLRRERAFVGRRDQIARTMVDDAELDDPAETAEDLDHEFGTISCG